MTQRVNANVVSSDRTLRPAGLAGLDIRCRKADTSMDAVFGRLIGMSTPTPNSEPDRHASERALRALRARLAPRWLNAPPLLVATAPGGQTPELVFIEPSLADRAILLVFWDYTCALSLRTIPFLNAWHSRFARFGLTVIGVHAPEFSFGAERTNVERALVDLCISYPVVLDNDFAISEALANRCWPRTLLLDRAGETVLDHAGAAGYSQIGARITAALTVGATRPARARPQPPPTATRGETLILPATPDLYGGFLRNSVGNGEGLDTSGAIVDYAEENRRTPDQIYLRGRWRATRESLVTAPEAGSPSILRLRCTAGEVAAVLRGMDGGTLARVLLNGRPVPRERSAADLGRGEDGAADPGASVLRAGHPRLYRLVRGRLQATMEIALVVDSGELEVFALRFQGGLNPPGKGEPGSSERGG